MKNYRKLAAEIEAVRQHVLATANDLSKLIASMEPEEDTGLDVTLAEAHQELLSAADYLSAKDSEACPIRSLEARS